MTIKEKIAAVRSMRAELDAVRDLAPPDEWSRWDARLREIEHDLAELVAMTRYTVQRFERPDLWDREP